MSKLTDTQLIVLSSAAKHDEGLATKPINLHAAAAQKVASSLINKGLGREIRAKADAPVWHENDDGRFALKITKAGREAIGVEDEAQDAASTRLYREFRRRSGQVNFIGESDTPVPGPYKLDFCKYLLQRLIETASWSRWSIRDRGVAQQLLPLDSEIRAREESSEKTKRILQARRKHRESSGSAEKCAAERAKPGLLVC
jgi:hypothetical protein